MKKILIVQAQQCLYSTLVSQISAVTGLDVDVAQTLDEASALLEANHYFLMLLDKDLSQESDSDILLFLERYQIPVILMADKIEAHFKEQLPRSLVIDYVIKESPEVITHIIKSVHRIYHNISTKVLVVDDAASDRKLISMLAKHQRYQVLQASDGEEAIEILKRDRQIKIIVADIHMPKMDGIKLLKYIRERKLQNELAILGVSSDMDSLIRFMKLGANDFIKKPFTKSEFITRLNHLADVYEQIKELDELSSRDYLTGLRSRKFFFEEATPYIYQAYKQQTPCAVAMIDVDDFKAINDHYGHTMGDDILKHFARLILENIRATDSFSRWGGEEFVLLLPDTALEHAKNIAENLRLRIENNDFGIDEKLTSSFGVTVLDKKDTKESLFERADKALYEAKNSGRNKVCINI